MAWNLSILPPSIASICELSEWSIFGTTSLAGSSGIVVVVVPLKTFAVVAPSQRAVWTHQAPRTLSKLWFSW